MDGLKVLKHRRLTKGRPDGIFGMVFNEDGTPLVCTVERPWANNQDGISAISAIPAGEYVCQRLAPTDHFPYEHFEVTNVPGRTGILFHKGNVPTDSKGCIIICTGPMGDGRIAGKMSADAFQVFMTALTGLVQFKLVVEDAP